MFCWTWWSCGTLGWALQASQYMDGLQRQKEGPAAVWLAVFFKVWFQWLLTLSKCESLLSGDDVLTSSEGLILLMAPYLCPEVWKQGHFFTPGLTPISFHHWAVDPSVLLRSGGFYLTLAQWFCLRSASLGRPFSCCVSVVHGRLQRTISVMAGRTNLAAAIGVIVWNGRRSFHHWMGGTVGLNGFRFD